MQCVTNKTRLILHVSVTFCHIENQDIFDSVDVKGHNRNMVLVLFMCN